uniref:Uncharacterized protein n=1 Tax=Romanomermis culicivorax TaxID=13658 RepID=A0A915JEG3_ROMCU
MVQPYFGTRLTLVPNVIGAKLLMKYKDLEQIENNSEISKSREKCYSNANEHAPNVLVFEKRKRGRQRTKKETI